jgi:ribose transport system substrate-binding protein
MRTRTIAVVATLGLLGSLSLGACGDGGSGSSGGERTITLVQGIANEPFYISMYCGAKQAAAAAGVKLEVQAPAEWDVEQQTEIVDAVAANQPSAVLIAPVDKDAMAAPIRQLASNDSKVILVDTDLTDTSIGLSRISSDNKLGGQLGARELAKLVGGKGKVLLLSTVRGTATTDARVEGFKEEMKKHPGIQIVGEQYPGDDAAKAQDIVTSTLSAHPDLAGVFAANLVTGEGASTALQGTGKVGTVKLVEFDASPKQVEALRAGSVQALISQEPLKIGQQGVEQAVAALDGKEVTKQIRTELVAVTKDNLDDPKVAQYLYKSKC